MIGAWLGRAQTRTLSLLSQLRTVFEETLWLAQSWPDICIQQLAVRCSLQPLEPKTT